MKVLIAPDKFKGTLSASEAADAMAEGVRKAVADSELHLRPVSDGGDGFVDAVLTARGGRMLTRQAAAADGSPIGCPTARLADGDVVVAMADSAGRLPAGTDPMGSSTYGTGLHMLDALALAPGSLWVGVGGSLSTDGGTGAARAAGWRFLDATGRDLPLGGGSLARLARIASPPEPPPERRIVAACDVAVPLTGPGGAARRFAPQKGATSEQVERLDEALAVLADRMAADLGVDVSAIEHAGAGGGMGAGLAAFWGAEVTSGFVALAEMTGLEAEIARADLVITGEGRLDPQSLTGKAPAGVARLARAHGVRCLAVCGRVTLGRDLLREAGFEATVSTERWVVEISDPAERVVRATEDLLLHVLRGPGPTPRRRWIR